MHNQAEISIRTWPDWLTKLAKLKEDGVITEEDHAAKKKALLGL